ncbi:hypothetical protein M3Y99_00907000 [Aphelenchoides fujianensis]|nr:hypothetical protein M3Y99_00907000 [Aphelenchoides fujianensis]
MPVGLSTSFVLLGTMAAVVCGQEVLRGLPPIPGDPLPTTIPPATSTHRLFRFGPFLPFIPLHQLPAHHQFFAAPTVAPPLARPFDPYNYINPVPELPPQPESKLNGYFDLDGNFVPYGSQGALGLNGRNRPKRAAALDSEDETLKRKLLEEEAAYDEIVEQMEEIDRTAVPQAPAKPLFVSGNARSKTPLVAPAPSKKILDDSTSTKNAGAHVSKKLPPAGALRSNAPLKHAPTISATTTQRPMHSNRVSNGGRVSKKPKQIDAHLFAQRLLRTWQPTPAHKLRKITPQPPKSNFRPKSQPAGRVQPKPLPQQPQQAIVQWNGQPQRQPLQVASQPQQFFAPPQSRAWAAPLAVDTRDPTVIAYLRDVEDYDWNFKGERPDLELPARLLQGRPAGTTPETLVPLGGGGGQAALIGTSPPPFVPARATASFTAPPPPAVSLPPAAAFTPAPVQSPDGGDLLGIFGGTPHPLFDIRRLFGGLGGR